MRSLPPSTALLLATLIAAPAQASFSGGGDEPKTPAPPASATAEPTPRQIAERLYADAYDEVAKAKEDLAAGKKKNAEKKFKKALARGEEAAELDTTYHEAWNLVGYSARQLGDYDRSLAAYHRCLRLAPDYAPAREYLGEAYVELGQPEKAREQLAWLERLEAEGEAASLKARLDAWLAAHPEAASKAPRSAPAAADSTAPVPGGSGQ